MLLISSRSLCSSLFGWLDSFTWLFLCHHLLSPHLPTSSLLSPPTRLWCCPAHCLLILDVLSFKSSSKERRPRPDSWCSARQESESRHSLAASRQVWRWWRIWRWWSGAEWWRNYSARPQSRLSAQNMRMAGPSCTLCTLQQTPAERSSIQPFEFDTMMTYYVKIFRTTYICHFTSDICLF